MVGKLDTIFAKVGDPFLHRNHFKETHSAFGHFWKAKATAKITVSATANEIIP